MQIYNTMWSYASLVSVIQNSVSLKARKPRRSLQVSEICRNEPQNFDIASVCVVEPGSVDEDDFMAIKLKFRCCLHISSAGVQLVLSGKI